MNINLNVFCQTNHPCLDTPWSEDEWTFASNGFLIVRVKRLNSVPEKAGAPIIKGSPIEDEFNTQVLHWQPCPRVTVVPSDCEKCNGTGKRYTCPECDGEGAVQLLTDWNDYGEETCKTCNGNGQLDKDHWLNLVRVSNPAGENCRFCDGTGQEYKEKAMTVWDFLFTDTLLALVGTLPGCHLGFTGKRNMARFRFDGGDGVLMSHRQDS